MFSPGDLAWDAHRGRASLAPVSFSVTFGALNYTLEVGGKPPRRSRLSSASTVQR
jgi:hypothetical protein